MLTWCSVLPGDESGIESARAMFLEYQHELGVDLCFQSFEEELATLPGKYGPPGGVLFLGWDGDQLAACGALRPLDEGVCEIKRIYVRPAYRRRGIARELSELLIAKGLELDYRVCKLDTLRRLTGAVELYESLGFTQIEAYNYNPEPDTEYMEKVLIGD